ncbi:hypothetical protein D8B26_000336 [Coccidioides posadasii str. Silveira]|uniref:uncharacterized protein n=1 Tax=Coccidioides posadasii (strain RMSCC 757 / Silveira) TaxID=443226 RepID=UPI001BF01D75|nr:hypothetical protein D8B26_000336 [Coccidioides posadasii str. Silveira]
MELHRKSRREQLKSITDLAESLYVDVGGNGSPCNITAQSKFTALRQHIETASRITRVPESSAREALDAMGTKLWNACTRSMRKDGLADDIVKFLSQVRAFAFLILECAATRQRDDCSDEIRLLRTALKTAKSCIVLSQFDIGLKILEKAALREEKLSTECSNAGERDDISLKLSAEYYILRIHLAWKQSRLDFAEHMLSKLPHQALQQDAVLVEQLSSLLFEVGKFLVEKKEYHEADKWLQRALETLSQRQLDMLSPDASDMRLCIIHGLVRANNALHTADSRIKVTRLLSILENEYGHRPEVMLLHLDVIQTQKDPDCKQYYDRLCAFLKTASASELNFKLIVHHIHQLRNCNSDLATDTLEQLILERLAPYGNETFLERGFVTYVWMKTASPGVSDGVESLQGIVTKLMEAWKLPLSGEAAHASLILIWKKVAAAFDHKDYDTARNWCQLALHPLFANSGESNKCKIERRLIVCALECKAPGIAREVFSRLSEACKSEALTRYLMYRVALQDEDTDLARNCLEIICKFDTERQTYLLACVAEALHSGADRQAAIVLQQILDHLDSISTRQLHFPALLRCTARLLITQLSHSESHRPDLVGQICKTFDSSVSRNALDLGQLTVLELEWFSRNSYNLALQYCTTWGPHHVLRLLDACIKIIALYPENLGIEARRDIEQRNILCHFLAAVIEVAQARTHNDSEVQNQFYLNARAHIQGFRKVALPLFEQLSNDESLAALTEKRRTLFAFDFEAAVRLKQWSNLSEMLNESRKIADEMLYSLFADAVLSSEAPVEVMLKTSEQILTQVSQERKHQNLEKISRWVRCVFQLSIKSNAAVAESILDQAYILARDGPEYQKHEENSEAHPNTESVSRHTYPDEELEWLSTTAFNLAIDFYLASDDMASQRWYGKALDLARLLHDNGVLWKTLQEKFGRLTWDD